MTSKAEALIELASAEFELTEPEQKFLQAVAAGEEADYRDEDEALNDPARAEEWGEERCLRASLLVWLCTDKKACKHITHRGLRVAGAKIIAGELDLQFAHLELPLIFHQCAFPEPIDLTSAKVRFLDLSGSHVGAHRERATPTVWAIDARGLQVESDIWLGTGFHAIGGVRLSGATIGGGLSCSKGRFDGQGGVALNAESAEVKGSMFLRNGFHSTGRIWLGGITIGGVLDCDNGRFDGQDGVTLEADSAEVNAGVFLRNGFQATGGVRLLGATIGGDLDCNNGRFDGQGRDALNAQDAEVKGTVFLRNFQASGCVWLLGATIGGDLDCDDGHLDGQNSSGLMASGSDIRGHVRMINFHGAGLISFDYATIDDGFYISTNQDQVILDLRFASVGTLWDSEASWPQPGNLRLEGFTYGKIHPNAPLSSCQRLKWLQLQDQKSFFSPQPYEQLARVLQASGREEDATAILIGKQEDTRKYAELSRVDRFWNWFLGKTIAHGYKSTRALWASLVIVGLGIIPFHFGYRFGLVEPSDLEAYTIANPNLTDSLQLPPLLPDNDVQAADALAYPEFFSPTYSLDVFLPIIDFHQAQYWLPKASRGPTLFTLEFLMLEVRWGGVLLAYFWLHIILGWVFTSLWVAGFTGLVRRLE